MCCDCDLWEPITQDKKRFSVLRKKRANLKTTNITTTFGESLFLTQYRMRYGIYIPLNKKDLAINQTTVAYENQQNATTFSRANNSDLLQALKHLMETFKFRCVLVTVEQKMTFLQRILFRYYFIFQILVKYKISFK